MLINILAGAALVLALLIAIRYGYIAANRLKAMGEITVGEMGRAAQMGDKDRIEQWMSERIHQIRARALTIMIVAILVAVGGGVTLVLRLL